MLRSGLNPVRALLRGLILVSIIALTGCVYLRMLTLRNQLRDFKNHFTLAADNGLRLTCREPLLLPDDLRWLGAAPETITAQPDGAESWSVHWVSDSPPPASDHLDGTPTPVLDIEIGLTFRQGKLTELTIPERYFAFFPKKLLSSMIESSGHAAVDRDAKSAEVDASADAHVVLPTLDTITTMLGAPIRQELRDGATLCHYRYRAVTRATPAPQPIRLELSFSTATRELSTLSVKLPPGTIRFRIAKPTPPTR